MELGGGFAAAQAGDAPALTTVSAQTVAIIERLPAYRRGLAAAFADVGFAVEELAAYDESVADADVVVFTIDSEAAWVGLTELLEAPGVAIVALLEDATVTGYRRALRLGLAGTVSREASTEQIVAVVCAALAGTTLLPCPIARQLAERGGVEQPLPISDNEAGWLRAMADGATIATLAQAARYSERQMHRLIANLYKRIGAANRQQALVFAARYGILDA